ncbi:MAG: hypothetical protein KGZ82_11120 [Bacteroidales bacterium]|nr:hypothetical protein [Bacteroidales bacterium]
MNGQSHLKNTSSTQPISGLLTDLLILGLLGAGAAALRIYLRIPLNIPGHHGLEVMALLLIGRQYSGLSIAGSVTSASAALVFLMPFAGIKDPFLPVIFLLIGAFIDLTYRYIGTARSKAMFLIAMGGIAYVLIPLSRILISLTTSYPYESLMKGGFVWPVVSHFFFGALGGWFAWFITRTTRNILS